MDALEGGGLAATAIEGVWTQELAVLPAPGGEVLHMLRSDSPLYRAFGEVYFSVVEPGAVKAWKRHFLQTQLFAVPSGLVNIVLYDDRAGSPSRGAVQSFLLGRPGYYRLLRVPPLIWYGFTSASSVPGLLANCTDMPHTREESERLPADSSLIPYSWTRQAHEG